MLRACLGKHNRFALILFLSSLSVVPLAISGCSGSSNSSQTAAPSSLSYPTANITAITGQAITSATPSVTGSVTAYSISPALPAGLSLDSSTGKISGTPTATNAQTTYTIMASNSGGSTSTTLQITVNVPAPTGLNYPQTTITATVGQAIAADTPTVTGTVTSYTIAPALPAGLSLNSSTGNITGTPTAIAAQARYVVTASNVSGSTTASLQITVLAAIAAPTALSYPQASISATVGQPIIPDIPSYTGAVTSFSVNPALPAGLNLDPLNGTITGAPAAVLPSSSYTVTASNAGGSVIASVSLVVNKAYVTAMDLGHGSQVTLMRSNTNRLLSQDTNGHWALWDTGSDSEVASGDQFFPTVQGSTFRWPVDMAGTTIAVGQPNGLEIRSAADGHLVSLIAAPGMVNLSSNAVTTWWRLASDGSYVCAGSSSGLVAWSLTGQQLLLRQGNYSQANAYAAPGQIQVAQGPAGQNVIETITISSGTSGVGPTFSGSFNSWFLDGQRYLTNTGTTVWTYSASSVQQGIVSLPTIQNLSGEGNWISIFNTASPYTLAIYQVGENSPTASFTIPTGVGTQVISSGTTVGLFPPGSGSGSVIDLSGSTPIRTDFTVPIAMLSSYTATTASKWFVANNHGVILDGSSTNATRTLNFGQVWSMAGGTMRVAVATANGSITYFNPALPTNTAAVTFSSSKIALSSDDAVLAAVANSNDVPYLTDRTLNLYALPAGTLTSSISSQTGQFPTIVDFSLSGSGTVLGQVLLTLSGSYLRQVGPIGGATVWSDSLTTNTPIQISPDGTLIAVPSGSPGVSTATNLFKNGALITAIPGWAIGWLDNSRVLVKTYALVNQFANYSGSSVYDSTGAKLSTSSVPEFSRIQSVGSDQVYSPDQNTIFSLSNGQPVWTATSPSTQGAVAGSYIVFASGSRILVDTW